MSLADIASPPRYLVRRLAAYYVDMVLAWLLLAALLGFTGYNNFSKNFDDRPNIARTESHGIGLNWAFTLGAFNVPVVINTQNCADAASEVIEALMVDDKNLRAKSMQLCFVRSFGVPSAVLAKWVLERTGADGKITEESGTTELVFDDVPVKVAKLLGIVVLILISALSTWKLKTTPGKWLLRLRFKDHAPKHPLGREIIKNLPNLAVLIPLVPFDLGWLAAPETSLLGMNIATLTILIVHIAAVALLWLYPFRNSKAAFFWSEPGEIILRRAVPPSPTQPNEPVVEL